MSRILALLLASVTAQVTDSGRFWSTLYGKDTLSDNAVHALSPPLDNQLLVLASIREDERQPEMDPGPPKFAEAIDFVVDSKGGQGEWMQRGELWIWRAQVASPGALSLSLLFEHFELAAGSEFYIKTDSVRDLLSNARFCRS